MFYTTIFLINIIVIIIIFFKAEHSYKGNPKLLAQLQHCEENGIPLAVILGQDEIERNVVKVRKVSSREEQEIARDQLTGHLLEILKKS